MAISPWLKSCWSGGVPIEMNGKRWKIDGSIQQCSFYVLMRLLLQDGRSPLPQAQLTLGDLEQTNFVAKAPGHYCSVGKHMKSDIIIFSFNYTKFKFEAENEPLQGEIPVGLESIIFRFHHINLRWCIFQSVQSLEVCPIVQTESEPLLQSRKKALWWSLMYPKRE